MSSNRRNQLARLIRDTIRATYVDDTSAEDAAYINDDDPLDDVVVDGHIDLLAIADAILAHPGPRGGEHMQPFGTETDYDQNGDPVVRRHTDQGAAFSIYDGPKRWTE